jgi:hypothetical protein
MNIKLAQTSQGIDWLEHFQAFDRLTAENLLNGVTWISAFEFTKALRANIKDKAKELNGPIGLFIEREIPKNQHGVHPFYKQRRKPKSAYGAAKQPIESRKYSNYEIGSEGVIATLATEIKREQRDKFFLQPTVNQIREKKIENFFILTDTIGSGSQISNYLDSLWKVATIKSLHSFKKLNFFVIAYTTTPNGIKKIKSHKTRPSVIYSIPCPTIDSVFNKNESEEIKRFCEKYYLKQNDKNYGPLGYENCGTLIAYAHGIPNNSPLVLHKKSKKKIPPLFQSRVIGKTKEELNTGALEVDHSKILLRNKQLRLSTSKWLDKANNEAKNFIVVLASLNITPRSALAISKRTSIKIDDVEKHLNLAKECEWVAQSGRLTDHGVKQLDYIKKVIKTRKKLVWEIDMGYYPQSLRVP